MGATTQKYSSAQLNQLATELDASIDTIIAEFDNVKAVAGNCGLQATVLEALQATFEAAEANMQKLRDKADEFQTELNKHIDANNQALEEVKALKPYQ
ncbi:MAG: hypothetical protein J6C46_01610 [Clostridia bacterium]|nr:hypothetical protein [Clostridia bacterium]